MNITRTCPFTNRVNTLFVKGATHAGLRAWEQGTLIQDALPNVSVDHREFIMSGITPDVWERIFGREE